MRMIFAALALLELAGCASIGQGQASLVGASMDWRSANKVPAGMVGDILRKRTRGHE